MTQDFGSVIAFYNALRTFLVSTVGMTVAEALGSRDLVLSKDGVFLRMTWGADADAAGVGFAMGSSLDGVLDSSPDWRKGFCFKLGSGRFSAQMAQIRDSQFFDIMVSGPETRLYRLECSLRAGGFVSVTTATRYVAFEPAFAQTGGALIEAGA